MQEKSEATIPKDALSKEELRNQEISESFFLTATRLADFFHSNNIDYRFVGGYAISLLAKVSNVEPMARLPKDIDVIVFDRSAVVKLFQAGYKLKEESPSASDIKAEPEIMNPSYMIFTAEDPQSTRYVSIDVFIVGQSSTQATDQPFVADIGGVPFKFLEPQESLRRLQTFYVEHQDSPRYRDPHRGRMHSDTQKISILKNILKALER